MTKSDLIDTLRKETSLSKITAREVVELFFDEMSNALFRGLKQGKIKKAGRGLYVGV